MVIAEKMTVAESPSDDGGGDGLSVHNDAFTMMETMIDGVRDDGDGDHDDRRRQADLVYGNDKADLLDNNDDAGSDDNDNV